MNATAVLGKVALGYSPFVDVKRNVFATRLTVLPLRADAPTDTAALVAEVAAAWPEGGSTVSLNVAGEALLSDLLQAGLPSNVMVEIPSFFASDPVHADAIQRLHAAGTVLLIKGRPVREVPREVLPCFKYSVIDLADERRTGEAAAAPAGVVRSIPHIQSGVRTIAEMEAAFGRGAAAVLGWPIDDAVAPVAGGRAKSASADLQVIIELIQGVDREESPDRLEQILRRDPQLAFKLMRYINSPGFGLAVEVSSFGHAIRMMGHQRLKRWLALLLATASKDPNLKPLMFAAVRRGMVMEELVRSSDDAELRNDMFVCGVFSLLDHVFGVPFAELLKSIPVPPPVVQALVDDTGPLQPYLDAVRNIESGALHDYRALADGLLLGVAEVNMAQLRALSAAARLA